MILITGANGFLGKSIFNSLINKKETSTFNWLRSFFIENKVLKK